MLRRAAFVQSRRLLPQPARHPLLSTLRLLPTAYFHHRPGAALNSAQLIRSFSSPPKPSSASSPPQPPPLRPPPSASSSSASAVPIPDAAMAEAYARVRAAQNSPWRRAADYFLKQYISGMKYVLLAGYLWLLTRALWIAFPELNPQSLQDDDDGDDDDDDEVETAPAASAT